MLISRSQSNRKIENFIYIYKNNVVKLVAFIITLEKFNIQYIEDYTIILSDIINSELLCAELSKFFELIFEKLENLGAIFGIGVLCKMIFEK